MAQKSQHGANFEVHPSASSTSAAKDAPGTSTARKQSATPVMNGSTVSTVLPKMSDPGPPTQSISASSQPMEKSASDGSNPSSKDAAGGTAAPYGTRSRNRTGSSRINYAEDKDMDADIFEMYPERRDDESKKPTRQAASSNATANGNASRAGNGQLRKPLPDDSRNGSSHNSTKDRSSAPTPGSVSGANSTASGPASRKRKAAAQSSAAGNQAQVASNAHSAALQKKLGAISRGGNGYAETNLLTFENCGAKSKDGKMVADDGTVLKVNGECTIKKCFRFIQYHFFFIFYYGFVPGFSTFCFSRLPLGLVDVFLIYACRPRLPGL